MMSQACKRLSLLLAALLLLVGCGGPSSSPTEAPVSTEAPAASTAPEATRSPQPRQRTSAIPRSGRRRPLSMR